jgi:putative aldouronate transport system permease protein
MTLLALLPFILLIIASFTDDQVAVINGYRYLPEKWSLSAYKYIANEAETIFRAYGITIFITIVGTAVNLFLTSLLAYMLAQDELPGAKMFNFLVIFTMLFNGGLVPTYLIYASTFKIRDTIFALIVPNLLMNAFNIILVKNYFRFSLPKELFESSRLDGASEFQILKHIVLPLSKPIMATIGLMTSIAYWNDWQNGLYYLNDTKLYSVQNILNAINTSVQFLATNSVSGANITDIPTTTVRMAIAVVGILPIIIAYPFFQQYFVKGITLGAVKG